MTAQNIVTSDSGSDPKVGTVDGFSGVREQSGQKIGQSERQMVEIKTTAEALDRRALAEVQDIIKEAKEAHPNPVISADIKSAGVVSPSGEADSVVENGTTLVLPVDENSYQKGLHLKVAGSVINGVVVGVSSLSALAMWVTRLVKMAHKQMMKVVFRKEMN